LKDSETDDELAAAETGSRRRLAETWSRGRRIATPAGMIHQCLLAAWIVLVITWFVWETWLRDGVEDVNAEAHDQPHQPAISDQQVS